MKGEAAEHTRKSRRDILTAKTPNNLSNYSYYRTSNAMLTRLSNYSTHSLSIGLSCAVHAHINKPFQSLLWNHVICSRLFLSSDLPARLCVQNF